MFQSVLILLGVAVILYVGNLLLTAYLNKSIRWESFQPKMPVSVQKSVPADSPIIQQAKMEEPPQATTPSGPNPPNAQALVQKISP